MPRLFHQNMEQFTANPGRVAVCTTAFAAIKTSLLPSEPSVVGFTEIMSATPETQSAVLALAKVLNPTITCSVLVEVGVTAVGKQHEWIGIAWDPAVFTVTDVGMITQDTYQKWALSNTPLMGAAPPAVVSLPKMNFLADHRGPAYIVGQFPAPTGQYIISFAHNMFAVGEKSRFMANIPTMMKTLSNSLSLTAPLQYIMGGDFNVIPQKRGRNGDFRANVYAAPNAAGTGYENTTLSNPYDYWFSNRVFPALPDPAGVHVISRRPGGPSPAPRLPDHAGISFLI